jgi:hypothetical protein
LKKEENCWCTSSISADKVASITDRDFSYALTMKENKHAFIKQIEEKSIKKLTFDDKKGLAYRSKQKTIPTTINDLAPKNNFNIDTQLLRELYTALLLYGEKQDEHGEIIKIHKSTLSRRLNKNLRRGKFFSFFHKIKEFENLIGIINGKNYYRVLVMLSMEENGYIEFASPYMAKIIHLLKEKNTQRKRIKTYTTPHHSHLIHSHIANERNKIAVEIVIEIDKVLQQRGDKKNVNQAELITVKIKYSTIIDRIPPLKNKLASAKAAKTKNTILKRAFDPVMTLLKEKTDLYKYYKNLEIKMSTPTTSLLNENITITHKGICRSKQEQKSP